MAKVKEVPRNREACLTVHIGRYTPMFFTDAGTLDQVKLTSNKYAEYEQNNVFDSQSIFDYEELELITLTNHLRIVQIDQERTKKRAGNYGKRKADGFVFYLQPNALKAHNFRAFRH